MMHLGITTMQPSGTTTTGEMRQSLHHAQQHLCSQPCCDSLSAQSHCRENGMYYGGDPPAWTTMPDIPPEALFKLPDSSSSKAGIARLL